MIYGTSGIERGKVKTSKSKILGTSTWLQSTYHYTSCGRLDSVSGNNHINTSNGSTTTAHTYDGAGNIVRSQTSINAFGNTTTMQHTETIDDAGRPISEYIKINGGADKMIGQSVYNYKDQLITRYQGNTGLGGSVEWLQKTDYTYRLDGLLSKINDNSLTGGVQPITWCSLPQEHTPSSGSSYDERDLFYSILHYDEEVSGSSAPEQYNGNISHVEWQVKGRRKQMYAYTYDEYNRLTEAEYYDRNSGDTGWDASGIYDGEYTYDERGNILTLKRKGRMTGDSCFVTGDIDNLSYTYASNTNQLSTVTESASMTWGFKNPTSNTTPYDYDDNGSMTEDHYKGVVTVYNHLTLPVYIAKGTDSILMMYDAGGSLLRKQHKSGSTVVMTRDYIGGIEYVNDTLDAIYHSEGRIKYIDEVARYEYYIRDHLGNIRLTYSDLNADGLITTPDEIVEEMHYYPFGMMMEGAWMGSSGQYGYNGIEYESFLDLEMNLATYRGLDPTLGRWWQVDPKAEALYGLSPYNSMGNNPISNVDPEGDFFFVAALGPVLSGIISGAIVGAGINGTITAATGGNFLDGAWKGAVTGALGSGLGAIGGSSLSFAGNLTLGTAQGAITGGVNSVLNGGNFWNGAKIGALSGAVLTTITSENFKNLTKGKGFKNNANVFDDIVEAGASKEDILDYFNMKASFDPKMEPDSKFWFREDGSHGITVGKNAFESYDVLNSVYMKEVYHLNRYLTGNMEMVEDFYTQEMKWGIEEFEGAKYHYRNQGLYPKNPTRFYDVIKNIESQFLSPYSTPFMPYNKKWWHIIYKIPRRY